MNPDGTSIEFDFIANTAGYEARLRAAGSAGAVIEASQDAMRRAGVKTTEQFEREAEELAHLAVALRGDALASAQVTRAKERLAAELRKVTGAASAEERQLAQTARATGALERQNEALRRAGIKTTAEFEREARELDQLTHALQGDAVATAQLTRAKDRLNREMRETAGGVNVLDRAASSAGGSAGGMAALARSGQAAIVAVAGSAALQAFARTAGQLYEIGVEAGETASKFATVFGPAAVGLDRALADLAHRAGLTRNEMRGIAATVGAIVEGMGYGQREAAAFTEQILRLSADIQSFSNRDINEVTAAVYSALTGEREQLKSLGIVINEADVQQRAMADSGVRNAAALTQQQKAAATLALITERAGFAIGDLDRTSDSAANTGRRLAAEWKEARDTLAVDLLPTIGLVLRDLDALTQSMGGGEAAAHRLAGGIDFAYRASRYFMGGIGDANNALLDLLLTFVGLNGEGEQTGTMLNVLGATLIPVVFGFEAVVDVARVLGIVLRVVQLGLLHAAQGAVILYNVFSGNGANGNASLKVQIDAAADSIRDMGADMVAGQQRAFQYAGALMRVGNAAKIIANVGKLGPTSPGPTAPDMPDLSAGAGAGRTARAGSRRLNPLQEAQQDARELGAELRYLESADGRAAVALDRGNAALRRRIQLLREGGELARITSFMPLDPTVEGSAAYRLGEVDAASAQARNAARSARGRLAADRAAMVGATRGPGGGPVVNYTDGPVPVDVSLAGAAGALEEVNVVADRSVDAAQRTGSIWAATLGTLERQFGSAADVGRGSFADIVEAGETLASAAGASFGFLADAAATAYEATGEKSKAFFALHKAFAIGEAVANTYKAATGAYAALAPIPVVGPALGAAAAAAAVVAGLANVARIRSAQPGGGGGGGGSTSTASGYSVSATNAPSTSTSGSGGGSVTNTPTNQPNPTAQGSGATEQLTRTVADLSRTVEQLQKGGVRVTGELVGNGSELVAVVDNQNANDAAVGVNRRPRRGTTVSTS